jgi:CBS domain-containing protein
VGVTRAVYAIEDAFEHLRIHWMWWPAIGGLAVGLVGYFQPRTLGVGYNNITDVLTDRLPITLVASLCVLKFISWSISLGSGTSGGTLALLFTIGGALSALLGTAAAHVMPAAGVDVRIAALVGMAAIFAGASRALLTSAVFVFETTLQPLGLMPLLGGCSASFLVSCLLMRNSIMTEKIVRRGVRVSSEYHADFLDRIFVREMAATPVISLRTDQTIGEVQLWIHAGGSDRSHQGFPILDAESGLLASVLTRRDLLDPQRDPATPLREVIHVRPTMIYDDCTLREAADHMTNHDLGRLPVARRDAPGRVIAMLTRGDLLRAHRKRLDEHEVATVEISLAATVVKAR